MSRRPRLERWLKAYPRAWRERYGDELMALLEDQATNGRVPLAHKLSVLRGGFAERWHTDSGPVATARQRSGALQVLCAWCAFVIAGVNFAKLSEHWEGAVSPGHRHLGTGSYSVVQWGALVATGLVILGAVLVAPALARFVRGEGLRGLRARVRIPAVLTVLAGLSLVAVVEWAHHLSAAQRTGADGAYSLAFVALGVLAAVCLTSWTLFAVQVVLRLELSASVVRAETALAATLTALMAVMGAAVVVWWSVMAHARGFFSSSGSALSPAMIVMVVLMGGALAVALQGVVRTVTARRD